MLIVVLPKLLIEVELRQPATGLLGGHGLGNLHSHLAKPTPAVEAVRRSLNLTLRLIESFPVGIRATHSGKRIWSWPFAGSCGRRQSAREVERGLGDSHPAEITRPSYRDTA